MKNNKNKPLVWMLLIFLAVYIASLFIMKISTPVNQNSNSSNSSTNSDSAETIPAVSADVVGNMELLGCNRKTTSYSPVTFYYYRDIVTDQMFLISYNTSNHTITPIVHPETGLPLTYTEYQKMEDTKKSS
jgi:hypothetical protein